MYAQVILTDGSQWFVVLLDSNGIVHHTGMHDSRLWTNLESVFVITIVVVRRVIEDLLECK